MSSSDLTRSIVHAARLAARGIAWVDAPVSGGPEGAYALVFPGGIPNHG
ncbi:MAG: NAD(P)-binding domain-containing protein [Chloroflexales bacterium]|nr:NAD(P)-binding domain-containing protein [Chloroflexales bacterium]